MIVSRRFGRRLGENGSQTTRASRDRYRKIVKVYELIGLVGIERFGVKVSGLARVLGKSSDGVSKWMRRGAIRREADADFAEAAEQLKIEAGEEP